MNKKNNIKIFIAIFLVGIFGITGFFGLKSLNQNKSINYMDANYIANFDNNKKLVGSSDNVFVAKINKNLGPQKTDSNISDTLFKAEIIYNIKGKLSGNVNIIQEAGYDDQDNFYIGVGNKLLEEGNIYLLATIGNNYKINSHPNGSHLLLSKNDYENNSYIKFLKNNKKINQFREAYQNEIITEDGYKISSEKNLYKNLSKEEKQNFQNIESGFIK